MATNLINLVTLPGYCSIYRPAVTAIALLLILLCDAAYEVFVPVLRYLGLMLNDSPDLPHLADCCARLLLLLSLVLPGSGKADGDEQVVIQTCMRSAKYP